VGPSGFPFSGNGLKRPGCDINHTPPFSADAENQWSCISSPPIFLHGVEGYNFIFNLLKNKRNLLYIRNQSVPRCKHFQPRL